MKNNLPLVSIIMPAYNAEQYISESIKSVLAQSYKNWELIVVNDGSVDKTSDIVLSFDDKRIILIEQKNSGVSKTRNKGIENSHGEYISFLDSDDLWFKDKLEVQIKFMLENPQFVLSYTDYNSFVDKNKIIKNKQLYPFKIKNPNERIYVFNYIGTLTVMVKKNILEEVGNFDTIFFGPEDWDLWIRISKRGAIGYINKTLALYREHNKGISKNKWRQINAEYQVLQKHILKGESEVLKKYALWFYYLKLANFYFSQKKIKKFLIIYFKMIKLFPFKIENFSYPLKKVFYL